MADKVEKKDGILVTYKIDTVQPVKPCPLPAKATPPQPRVSGKQLASVMQPRKGTDMDTIIELIATEVSMRVEQKFVKHLRNMPPQIQPALLTVKDAAVYLGRTEQAIQHLIASKELPVVRAGRRVHLHRADLDAWIEKNKY